MAADSYLHRVSAKEFVRVRLPSPPVFAFHPTMKDGWRFTDPEKKYVLELFEREDVQAIIRDKTRRARYRDAAQLAAPLFKARFKSGYPGETDAEFKKRLGKADPQRKKEGLIVQRPPETIDEFNSRMDSLEEVSCPIAFVRHLTSHRRTSNNASTSSPNPKQAVGSLFPCRILPARRGPAA